MVSPYEIDKALFRLNSPELKNLPPGSRWRKTEFFGVPPEVMRLLEVQGYVEKRQVSEDRPVQWRKVEPNAKDSNRRSDHSPAFFGRLGYNRKG